MTTPKYFEGWEVVSEIEETCPDHGKFVRYQTSRGFRGTCADCELAGRRKREAEERAAMRTQHVEHLLSQSWLPARFSGKDFDNYNAETNDQRKALAACRKYIQEVNSRIAAGTCLVLIGPPGVGKTHLLAAVTRAAIHSCQFSRYTTMTAFLAAVKGSWAWHGAELGGAFLEPDLLVLDELWIPQTGRDRETLLAMLDARYLAQKPTLIGSNLPWPEMQKEVGMRFCDRLLEGGGEVLRIDGESMRK